MVRFWQRQKPNQTPALESHCFLELGGFMLRKNSQFLNKRNWKGGITWFCFSLLRWVFYRTWESTNLLLFVIHGKQSENSPKTGELQCPLSIQLCFPLYSHFFHLSLQSEKKGLVLSLLCSPALNLILWYEHLKVKMQKSVLSSYAGITVVNFW